MKKSITKINSMHLLASLFLFLGIVAFFSPDIVRHISVIQESASLESDTPDDEDFDETSDLVPTFNKIPWGFPWADIILPNAGLFLLQPGIAQLQPVIIHGKKMCIQYKSLKLYC